MGIVITTAAFTPRAGREEELRALLLELRRQIRAERGNLEYSVHRALDPSNPTLLVTQAFESPDAFTSHAELMAAIGAPARLAELTTGPLAPPKLFEPLPDTDQRLGDRGDR